MATIKVLRPDDFPGDENCGDNRMRGLAQESGPSDVNATGADERSARWQNENSEAIVLQRLHREEWDASRPVKNILMVNQFQS
ncbi:hypothetical protein [Paraburkholderia sp. XV]|uniref:hypothetical protein n=1 Tax=Paraburkholderia sp. XV TaxID=2831520 RepID=UPI001CD69B82|nr:hypothetical protein [Paraburkholderia sp. XV]